ncbi:MAG: GWxTD domain-containing protein [Candidatus Aegiribacteria sp.]|nr:GWxTD domain-containing protein [Candidatus Aegiribacteria sp.]
MTLLAMVLAVITGFQVNWNVEPARGQDGGTVHIIVRLSEEDLLFVMENSSENAFWEIIAAVDGDYTVRNSGSVIRSELPLKEEISISGLQPGTHLLTVIVGDLESGRNTEWEETIEVIQMDSASWSSGNLQIAGGLYQRASGSSEVVWTVYPPQTEDEKADSLDAAYVLRDENGITVREGWMDMIISSGTYRGVALLDISNLDAGEYEILAVIISDGEIAAASGTDLKLLQAWDVWGEDPDLTKTLIRPIAYSSELRELEGAEGPSSRKAVMAEFWQERDPTPVTVQNEFLEMYLARLDYIGENFSMLNTMGISTDQGWVFAQLGEPDMIDSRPFETAILPIQVWTYFSPPIEVLFIDYDGCGTFELATDWEEVMAIHDRH